MNDGEAHGDAPFLVEDGWRPLLNGADLAGWHGAGNRQNDWYTTAYVLWDRCWGRLVWVEGECPAGPFSMVQTETQ